MPKTASKSEPKTMAELLALYSKKVKAFSSGEKIQAKFVGYEGKTAVFDIGGKSEGLVSSSNFDEVKDYIKSLKPGAVIDAIVLEPESSDGTVKLSLRHQATDNLWENLEKAFEKDAEIEVIVRSVGDKGVTVEIAPSLKGFIPTSQLGKKTLKSLQKFIGKHLKVKIVELSREKRRIVLSERAVSEAADIELINKAFKTIKPGEKYKGRVTQVTNFGAFIELKVAVDGDSIPLEGLVHVSELSWKKIDSPGSVVSEGDEVAVKVLNVGDRKLALSIKQAESDPWEKVEKKYYSDKKVKGKIIRVTDFGVIVELEPGVEGLIHITKIPPGTNLTKAQEVDVYIEEADVKDRKISLGLVLTSKPIGYK